MRCITRLFSAGILAFAFFVLGATVTPSISSAEDVWVMSRDGFDHYMNTDTIKKGDRGYQVNVKLVTNGKFHNFRILNFFKENDMYMMMEEFDRTNGQWTVSSDNELGAPLWKAMKPYMKAKGISYPNLDY